MRQARVGRFMGLAAALGSAFLGGACSSTDATPPRPVHGSIGEETFGVLCDRNHRVVSIDELRFDARGLIEPVVITKVGVRADSLPARQ